MTRAFGLIVIPAQAGIQLEQNAAKQTRPIVPLRGNVFINWIPACAGMTVSL
jgi:hypothetical protein